MMKSKKVLREILADGGAVVLPTETVYGLFAKAMDESAVNHVYELKNRPRDKLAGNGSGLDYVNAVHGGFPLPHC